MSETEEQTAPQLRWGDTLAIGEKVVEMADRLVDVDLAMPGSKAEIVLKLDGKDFKITISRARSEGQ